MIFTKQTIFYFVKNNVITNFILRELIKIYIIEKPWFSTIVFIIILLLILFINFGTYLSILLFLLGLIFLLLASIIQLSKKIWVGFLNLFIAISIILLLYILINEFSDFMNYYHADFHRL